MDFHQHSRHWSAYSPYQTEVHLVPDYNELQAIASNSSKQPLIQSKSTKAPSTGTRREKATPWQRYSPLAAACCAAGLSTVPAILYLTGRSFGVGSFLYDTTLNHRTSEQVAVGMLASIFAYFWTYALCMSFNLMMRVHLSGRKESMDALRLYTTISKQALDWNLSFGYILLSMIFMGVLVVQTWLWQGALTPDFNLVNRTAEIATVRTGPGSYEFGDFMHVPADGGIYINCTRVTQTNGTFVNCPGRELAGGIVDAISNAGAVGGVPRNHSKPDNSGYNFLGRSHGIAASVGLMSQPELGNIIGYEYSELGYHTSANCIHNESSNYTLDPAFTQNEGGTPNLFLVNGNRPNDYSEDGIALGNGYVLPALGPNPDTIVAITAGSCCRERAGKAPFYASVAAGWQYSFLDKVQCEISFTPSNFNVQVSVDNRTISVKPQNGSDAGVVVDPEPRGALREWTLRGLQSLTMVQTTLYMSSSGEAFISTVVNELNNNTFDPRTPLQPAVLPPVSRSMEAALDEIMLDLGGFALTQPGGATKTPATFHVQAVQIGSKGFVIAVLVTNLLAFIVTGGLCIYTGFFADSPAFDFSDMGVMIAGVVTGRDRLGDHIGWSGLKLTGWTGDSRDTVIMKLRMEIDSNLGNESAPFIKLE